MGGTLRSEATVQTNNVNLRVLQMNQTGFDPSLCWTVNYLYGPLHGENGNRLGNGSMSSGERPVKEFMSSGNQ